MKKHLITLLILIFALPIVWADEINYEIKQENSVSQIETELQTLINNATNDDIVKVTGSKTNADITLTLNIGYGKKVVWEAIYHSSATFEGTSLISFLGSGAFEVTNGELISDTAEEIITSTGDEAMVLVSGGTISVKSGNAIVALGNDTQVFVSGGYLSNDADDVYPVIIAFEANPALRNAFVHISGTAKVEAKGYGNAVISSGTVVVCGDAQVSNTKGGSSNNTAAVRASHTVVVGENAKITASNNCAIMSYENVLISENCIIEAKEDAIAIFIYGAGVSSGSVNVMGQAQIIAANNYAISYNSSSYHLNLNVLGGIMFAYGNDISNVVNESEFIGPTGSGIILAWNKEAGNTNYEINSTEDIFILPESAIAYWDKQGTEFGISYINGENTGFIPLDVTVLSVNEQAFSNLLVYPNPTTGELKIENGELKIENVDIFDIYGRNLTSHTSYLLPHTSFDISHLPAGVYFVKIFTEAGVVVKKVVKE